jgi:hypothetical protein
MAFNSYADLQTAIVSWLARDDLTANIPDFITLFEATAARRLNVRPMQTTALLTPTAGVAALPAGYLGWIRATVQSNPKMDMDHVHPSYLQKLYASDISTRPAYFTIEGSSLKTRSSDTTSIELLYDAKNAAVSSSLNWLFTNHPDAYLFGSLAEANGFTVHADKLALWSARRDAVLDEIMMLDFREQGPMSIRVAGATP